MAETIPFPFYKRHLCEMATEVAVARGIMRALKGHTHSRGRGHERDQALHSVNLGIQCQELKVAVYEAFTRPYNTKSSLKLPFSLSQHELCYTRELNFQLDAYSKAKPSPWLQSIESTKRILQV